MPQRERSDEAVARETVSRLRDIELRFADHSGGIDHRSADGVVVLEVTRYTNSLLRRDMHVSTGHDAVSPLGTGLDWSVLFDGFPQYTGLAGRLYGALHALEMHGLHEWIPSAMEWWAKDVQTLASAVEVLRREKVEHAWASTPRERPSKLVVNTSGGWTYGGPDAALALIEGFVRVDLKHLKKLGAEAARERHLWLWTDVATDGGVRRALDLREDRLPSRPPSLPPEVTHLWIADDVHGRGLGWDRNAGWFRFDFNPPE